MSEGHRHRKKDDNVNVNSGYANQGTYGSSDYQTGSAFDAGTDYPTGSGYNAGSDSRTGSGYNAGNNYQTGSGFNAGNGYQTGSAYNADSGYNAGNYYQTGSGYNPGAGYKADSRYDYEQEHSDNYERAQNDVKHDQRMDHDKELGTMTDGGYALYENPEVKTDSGYSNRQDQADNYEAKHDQRMEHDGVRGAMTDGGYTLYENPEVQTYSEHAPSHGVHGVEEQVPVGGAGSAFDDQHDIRQDNDEAV